MQKVSLTVWQVCRTRLALTMLSALVCMLPCTAPSKSLLECAVPPRARAHAKKRSTRSRFGPDP